MQDQPDYLADVGKGPRLAAVIALAPFALLFTAMTVSSAVAGVVMAVRGEWRLAAVVMVSALFCGLLAAGLFWLVRRLYRGARAANGLTVIPAWFIQCIGLLILPGAAIGAYRAVAEGNGNARYVPLVLGPPVAMIIVPWLVKRRLQRAPARASAPPQAPREGTG